MHPTTTEFGVIMHSRHLPALRVLAHNCNFLTADKQYALLNGIHPDNRFPFSHLLIPPSIAGGNIL